MTDNSLPLSLSGFYLILIKFPQLCHNLFVCFRARLLLLLLRVAVVALSFFQDGFVCPARARECECICECEKLSQSLIARPTPWLLWQVSLVRFCDVKISLISSSPPKMVSSSAGCLQPGAFRPPAPGCPPTAAGLGVRGPGESFLKV